METVWSVVRSWMFTAWSSVRAFADWTEKHPGLGGWVGAAGAIIAIFAAWGLARAEYNRVQRVEHERANSEIALFIRVTSEVLPFVQRYVALAEAQDPSAIGYSGAHGNDGVWRRAADLNWMPVTQWPSVESYDAFKDFFITCARLIETPAAGDAKQRFEKLKAELVPRYELLQKTLMAARK
jgi:hypothetical protein